MLKETWLDSTCFELEGGTVSTKQTRRAPIVSVKMKLYGGFMGIVIVFAIAATYQVVALGNLRGPWPTLHSKTMV
jgi:hypothetical protein